MLKGKKILLGISGGIAAYKALFLIRLLKKKGAEVRVVTTAHALEFVTELSLRTLSSYPVYSEMFSPSMEYATEHIALADWADCAIVAPATANCIGKYISGIADDALSTVLLALDKPLFVCPAMNSKMFAHFAVQENLKKMQEMGIQVLEPATGFLACGEEAKGRMEEPENIVARMEAFFSRKRDLVGKRVLITAGPTYEKIDRVRFIGNFSTGKMGFSLAEEFASRGAEVVLLAGPVALECSHPAVRRQDVVSAREMYDACLNEFPQADIAVLSAAVADYRPESIAPQKIKKSAESLNLSLVCTEDILRTLGGLKKDMQVLVGFALETENEFENAIAKLHAKNADCIVLNSLNDIGAGFQTSTNKISIFNRQDERTSFPLLTKRETANKIVDYLLAHFPSLKE